MTFDEIIKIVSSPKLSDLMPKNFDVDEEAKHLSYLIENCETLQSYVFEELICSGGSGMVFRVRHNTSEISTALKVVRKRIYDIKDESPFSSEELEALKELSHPNIVRLYDTVKLNSEVVAVCTSYIDNAQGIDLYIQEILNKKPTMYESAFSQVSVERLETTCRAVISWVYEIAQAINHMHRQGYYHLDIKPANILMQGSGSNVHPIITDMGSCMKKNDAETKRVHFTWAYAHPDLTDIFTGRPGSIEGGALRASAKIGDTNKLPVYDLYALGKTIQQILAVIDQHFGEVCYSSYSFRYLHIISGLLLDGKNAIEGEQKTDNTYEKNGILFVSSFPMNLSKELLEFKKISSSAELLRRLKRFNDDYSIIELAPEFNPRCSDIINNTVGDMVPFTKRVAKVFNHPAMKRLYNEPQLGLMTEIYPGASHNRWSHSLGVFAIIVKYYISLFSDPENPLLRIITDKIDVDHAFLSAILHDIGQTSMCHDLEAVNKSVFDHLSYIKLLIDEKNFGDGKTLREVINDYWGGIDINRIISILNHSSDNPIDHVASDCIDGAIDADKLDYIKRDSYYCGVSYGDGIDYGRIMDSLTVSEKSGNLRLAYYTKGRTAMSAMLLARYQMYGSVYWHHTYRCLHSMLFYATQTAFGYLDNQRPSININRTKAINLEELRKLYYYRVICRLSWEKSWDQIGYQYRYIYERLKVKDNMFTSDYSVDFVYAFANDDGRSLLKKLKNRSIFRRIYSKSLKGIDISELAKKCEDRVAISKKIQESLFETIQSNRVKSSRRETAAELLIEHEIEPVQDSILNEISILVDFPQKIKVPVKSWPNEVGDAARKLQKIGEENANEIVNASNNLLSEVASIRVFAEPDFYRLITRYLSATTIETCISKIIDLSI